MKNHKNITFDTIIFDLDGVLVDVSKSYQILPIIVTKMFYNEILGLKKLRIKMSREDVTYLKNVGGFNNDWDITYFFIDLIFNFIFPDVECDTVKISINLRSPLKITVTFKSSQKCFLSNVFCILGISAKPVSKIINPLSFLTDYFFKSFSGVHYQLNFLLHIVRHQSAKKVPFLCYCKQNETAASILFCHSRGL